MRNSSAISLLLMLLLFPLPYVLAGPGEQTDAGQPAPVSRPPVEVVRQGDQLRRLQEAVAGQKDKIEGARRQEKGLQQELAGLNQRLEVHSYKYGALQENLASQETLLAQEQERLGQTLAERQLMQQHLQSRLAAYYRMGSIGLLNVVFSKKSLAELLSFQEYFHYLLDYDRQAIASFQGKINEQQVLQEKLRQEKARLQDLVNEVAAEEKALSDARREKTALLERARTEEQLYGQAAAEIEKAAAGLTALPGKAP